MEMTSVIRVKEGVRFDVIAPGGFRLLSAVEITCRKLNLGDFWITSACDGCHSGQNDPHHRGEAYDVRSHTFSVDQKNIILNAVQALLPADQFYCFLESPGTDNEH